MEANLLKLKSLELHPICGKISAIHYKKVHLDAAMCAEREDVLAFMVSHLRGVMLGSSFPALLRTIILQCLIFRLSYI